MEMPIKDEYVDLTGVIGSGSHANVYKSIHMPTGKVVAKKVFTGNYYCNPNLQSSLIREIAVLSRSSHDCPKQVVKLDTFWVDKNNGQVCLVSEWCKGGSLKDLLHRKGRLAEPELAFLAKEIVTACLYMCNRLGMRHRDLKPGNILITGDGQVKVADFGEAGRVGSLSQSYGTLGYKSPEGLKTMSSASFSNLATLIDDMEKEEEENFDGEKEDVWSLGLTLFEAATGTFPYSQMSLIELCESVKSDPPPSLPIPQFSASARHFVEECLRKSPRQRASFEYLQKHPFLKKAADRITL